jgi:hypothetical protein
MLGRIRRLPSPALVISAIALIVAVGGGTFAIAASSDKKQDTKIARKVANKQITKRAPKLSVKHATSADSATDATNADHASSADTATNAANASSASNADTVGGVTVKGFSYQTPSIGSKATLFSLDGLTLTAVCSSGRVDARTSVDHAYISSAWVTPSDVPEADSDTDFNTADIFAANIGTGPRTGSIEYVQPNGRRVSVSLQADMASACTVSGHAFASG